MARNEKKLRNIEEKYKKLEREFIDYLNENKEDDEAKLVPIVEEHYWLIALEKLKEQNRNDMARKLYQSVNEKFNDKKIRLKKIYEHKESGEKVSVTYVDIIKYGNKAVWRDFGLWN